MPKKRGDSFLKRFETLGEINALTFITTHRFTELTPQYVFKSPSDRLRKED